MKRIIIAIAIVVAAFCGRAAVVDWSVSATSAEVDYTAYVFTSAINDNYASFNELIAGNIGTGKIVEIPGSRGKPATYRMASAVSSSSSELSSYLWVVLVSGSDASTYTYAMVNAASMIYDPNAQQTSPGALEISSSALTSSGTIGGTPSPAAPEPTSGLLLLLGMAGLALRRKQK